MRNGALAVAATALAGCATVGPVPEGPVVDRLRIEGNEHVKSSALKERLLTSEGSWLPAWVPVLGDEQHFDPNAWQADLRRIERFYQAHGYYDAKVIDEAVEPTTEGHVALRVRVREGLPTVLTQVEVRGLEALDGRERARVLEDLPLRVGEVFLEESWAPMKALLASRLRELGYAAAAVSGEASVDLATHTAQARLSAEPGPRYRFGQLFVTPQPGAKVPPARLVERVRTAVHPGEWYTESALAEAQARVFQMGVFGAVKVNRSAPDQESLTVPVVIDAREAAFHSWRAGGGVGIDQTRQEARGLVEYNDRNFLSDLRRFTFRAKGGYAFLPNVPAVVQGSLGSKSGVLGQVGVEFEQSRLFHPDLSATAAVDATRGLEPAYEYYGGSAKLGVVWRPRHDLSVFPSYNLDVYRLSSAAPLGGRSPAVTFGCPLTCVLSYLEQTIELDRRDDRMEPREGFYAALSLQEGGGPLQGSYSYLRLLPEVRGYASVGKQKWLTFAGKLKLGTLITTGGTDSPIVARFFSGGGSAMRGFNTRRLSPLIAVPSSTGTEPSQGQTLPVGGNGLLESSAEVRWNLGGDLVVALFTDMGFVTQGSFQLSDAGFVPRNWQWAVGLGVRYRTPLGPIRLDLARLLPIGPPLPVQQPPDQTLDYPTYNNCFGVGTGGRSYPGSPEGLCTLHVSIGEAF